MGVLLSIISRTIPSASSLCYSEVQHRRVLLCKMFDKSSATHVTILLLHRGTFHMVRCRTVLGYNYVPVPLGCTVV